MTTLETETPAPAAGTLTRRDFFAGAGMAAGAVAAIGGIAGTAFTPAAQAAVKSRKYFSTYIAFELDGQFAGPVLAAEGGDPVITPANARLGTAATVRYEPLEMLIDDMTIPVFDWIGKSSAGTAAARSCAIVAYGMDGKEVYRLNMQGARVTGIETDSFEAASREPLRLTVKVTPTSSSHQIGGKSSYSTTAKLRQNTMMRSNFRLYVQGLEGSAPRVVSVDKVGLTLGPDGSLTPLPLKFNLAFPDAGPMVQWMQDTLQGKSGARPGELQMLSVDLSKVIASATFEGLMITRVGCPLEASSDKIQFVEVECAPAAMKFNMGELLT